MGINAKSFGSAREKAADPLGIVDEKERKQLADPYGFFDKIMGDSSADDAQAADYQQKALAAIEGLSAPDLQKLELDPYKWNGDFAPVDHVQASHVTNGADLDALLAQAAQAGPSAMEGVSVDPRLKGKQDQSLDALDEIINGGGLTAADKANLSRIQNDVAAADRGRRGAIQQGMNQRGMGGSGMDLLAQLQSSQAATDQANQSGLDIAGQAQQRALDSIMQSGQLAGDMRNQDFGEQAQIAQARDAIAKFNAQNTQQTNLANAGAGNNMLQFNRTNDLNNQRFNSSMDFDADRTNAGYNNTAAEQSWAGRQQNSDQNTDLLNKANEYNNATLPQQTFDNARNLAGMKANAYGNQSGYYSGKAAQTEAAKGAAWGAAGQVVGSIFGGGIGAAAGAAAKGASNQNSVQQGQSQPGGYTYGGNGTQMGPPRSAIDYSALTDEEGEDE